MTTSGTPQATADSGADTVSAAAQETSLLPGWHEAQEASAEGAAKNAEATIEQIRKRADNWGKGALALGSAVVTTLGIGGAGEILPHGNWPAAVAILVGCGLAIGALVFIGTRLTKVSIPIVMKTRVTMMNDLSEDTDRAGKSERLIVEEMYARFAELNGHSSLYEYSATGIIAEATLSRTVDSDRVPQEIAEAADRDDFIRAVFRSIGPTVPHTDTMRHHALLALRDPELAQARAQLIRVETRAEMAKAATAIVRRRMVAATVGRSTVGALLLIPIAIVAAFLIADNARAADTDQRERLTDLKSCVDIAAIIADKQLTYDPPPCETDFRVEHPAQPG